MKCPACGADGAYVGAAVVECRRAGCRHFSQRQAIDYIKAEMARLTKTSVWKQPIVEVDSGLPGACEHDWVQEPVCDLTLRWNCSKCPAKKKRTMIDYMRDGQPPAAGSLV